MNKIFNAHCHIYPEKIAERAIEGINQFYNLDRHLLPGTVKGLLEDGEKIGVTNYLVHSVATVPAQVNSINEFIASEVNKHPDIFVGFGSLHPDSEDMESDLNHLIELGLKGVKLHPDFQAFNLDEDRGINMCKLISDKGLPVMIHCGDENRDFSSPVRVKNFLEALPDLKVIAAHLGGWSKWEEAAALLPGHNNLWLDCSSSFAYLTPDDAVKYIRKFGSDRIMFGTDYPMWYHEEEMELFNKLELTEEEREDILYKTAYKFLD